MKNKNIGVHEIQLFSRLTLFISSYTMITHTPLVARKLTAKRLVAQHAVGSKFMVGYKEQE